MLDIIHGRFDDPTPDIDDLIYGDAGTVPSERFIGL